MPAHSKTVALPSILVSKFNLFIQGATTPLRALELILKEPKLITLSLLPVFAALIVLSIFIYSLLAGTWALVHTAYLSAIANYSNFAFVIISIFLIWTLSFFVMSFLTSLMTLFASPVNDILAEKTERVLNVNDIPHWTVGRFFRVLWVDLRKTVISLFSLLVFSLGMMLPVANLIFMIGIFLLNTFTFITYPQSRREQGIYQSFKWIRENLFLSIGFGFATFILFAIPVVNFFALPISVVGGTLLFIEHK